MWRAFFIAIGIFFVLLGMQCLVVDQFFVSQNGKLGEIAVKAINVIDPPEKTSSGDFATSSQVAEFPQNGGGFTPSTSQYGPSRFANPFAPASNSNVGYGGTPFRNVGFRQDQSPKASRKVGKPPRPFSTQDWMPWSLIAAGALVVIYTRATLHSHSDEG